MKDIIKLRDIDTSTRNLKLLAEKYIEPKKKRPISKKTKKTKKT